MRNYLKNKKPETRDLMETLLPNVPRETLKNLEDYVNLVETWNLRTNLTGAKSARQFVEQHVVDCLQAQDVIDESPQWLDVGSGAGLPGIVWALLRPQEYFFLLESSRKKSAFLQHALAQLKISNAQVLSQRLEEISEEAKKKFSPEGVSCVSRGTMAPHLLLQQISKLNFPWKAWWVFSTKNTHHALLTEASEFGIKVEARQYERRGRETNSEIGILTKLTSEQAKTKK